MANTNQMSSRFRGKDADNRVFQIRNTRSETSLFYQINTPYQLTYEHCSGVTANDYLNCVTLSGDTTFYLQESYPEHLAKYQNSIQHFHDFYELMIVLEGSVTQRIEGKEYQYPQGTCCLVNRGLYHTETFSEESQVLFVGLSVDFIKDLFAHADRSAFHSERKIQASSIYRFIQSDLADPGHKSYLDFIPAYSNQSSHTFLHDVTTDLIQTLMDPGFGAEYLILGYISSLLAYLSNPEMYLCTSFNLSMNNEYLLFTRISLLFEEQNGRIARSDLERNFHYTSDYLNRIVKRYTGLCLHDYGMLFAAQRAGRLLRDTNTPVSEIAAQLGFSNRTYFYRLFETLYGCTPRAYRLAAKADPQTIPTIQFPETTRDILEQAAETL